AAAAGVYDMTYAEGKFGPRPQAVGDRFHHGGAVQHAGLRGADVEVAEDGIQLRGDEVSSHGRDLAYPPGILRRQRRRHARPVHAEGGEGQKISLQPGAARRVRAGDRQRDGGWPHGATIAHCPCRTGALRMAVSPPKKEGNPWRFRSAISRPISKPTRPRGTSASTSGSATTG